MSGFDDNEFDDSFESDEELSDYFNDYEDEGEYEGVDAGGIINQTCFCIKSKEGVSVNGVKFCKGDYHIGQIVGSLTIDAGLMNNLLGIDATSIRLNPDSA